MLNNFALDFYRVRVDEGGISTLITKITISSILIGLKNLLFSTNSLAKLLSDSLLLDTVIGQFVIGQFN